MDMVTLNKPTIRPGIACWFGHIPFHVVLRGLADLFCNRYFRGACRHRSEKRAKRALRVPKPATTGPLPGGAEVIAYHPVDT